MGAVTEPHDEAGRPDDDDPSTGDTPRVAVFAPAPVLVCTFEHPHDASDPEVALNVGGQGPWVARAVDALGAEAILVVPLGGDTGRAAGHLLSDAPDPFRVVPTQARTACYIEERRHGERTCIREAPAGRLGQREIDDLYSAALAAALDAGVCVITGSPWPDHIDEGLLTRLTADLGNLDCLTVADLSGSQLEAVVAGGVDWLKVSHEQLQDDHGVDGDDEAALWTAAQRLFRARSSDAADDRAERRSAGRRRGVVVSRASTEPTLAFVDGRRYRVAVPEMTTVDARGSGDAMTAALAAGLAERLPTEDLLRRAAAAGAANAVHKGTGTPDAELVARLTPTVEIEELEPTPEMRRP
jgi:1-phosphofructokinase